MDGASFAHLVLGQKKTGTIFSGAEGVFIFQIAAPDLTVTYGKISGNSIDILRGQQQGGSGQTIAAIPGTEITEILIAGQYIAVCGIVHQRKLPASMWYRRSRR
jgi:hypothetical protein